MLPFIGRKYTKKLTNGIVFLILHMARKINEKKSCIFLIKKPRKHCYLNKNKQNKKTVSFKVQSIKIQYNG